MLSIENPSSDPSCSPQFTGSDDEVDLLKQPSLDHHHHKNPLPNFSIRDYVFNGRSKDINKNWPFSSESLQLVLKHGMKDPLPPFQHLDIVRNQPKETHVVETNPIEKQRSTHHGVLDSYDIDSVLVDKQSISVEEGSSAQVKAVVALKSQKTEKTTKPSGKKCRLIVKFGGHSDCSSTEDIASNCSVVSESMGSKVCPVCKSFSSSSNTTLNAHMDQCLSVESTPKWTVDSKLTRHKIKPRKTKLLVDVYATAKSYTLEELDRRNGRSWALASNISDFEGLEMCDEGKNKKPNDEDVKDFLDMMLDVFEDEHSEIQLTRNHIKALILDFLTAATDTTAIAIEWALAELINNPEKLRKAQQELDQVVGKSRLVQESDTQCLPYLQAIIKESFRLHPPIPMISRKAVEDCKINGYTIPAQSLLFVNIWAIGRDPKVWEDPLKFQPERFLKCNRPDTNINSGDIDVKGLHYQLLPFGTGRRGCPGISLAMQELPVTLAALIQCFDWKLLNVDGGVDMSERAGLTAPRAHDLKCVPLARFTPTLFSTEAANCPKSNDFYI